MPQTNTLARPAPHLASGELRPKGLGGSALHGMSLMHGRQALPSGLRREWTRCKKRGMGTQTQALGALLDISLSLFDTMDAVKSSVDSELVFQATLQVPAHHALECRMQAYGTPFAAPDLHADAGQLSDADLEFAACVAAPPDLEEQPSLAVDRVISVLEANTQRAGAGNGAAGAQQARTAATVEVSARGTGGAGGAGGGGGGGGGGRAAPSALQQQQQLGGSGARTAQSQLASRTAPRVLISIDDAEAGGAQLERRNSVKKQAPLLRALKEAGRRATEALLGFGYLLLVMHERQLGGQLVVCTAPLTGSGAGCAEPTEGGIDARHNTHRRLAAAQGGPRAWSRADGSAPRARAAPDVGSLDEEGMPAASVLAQGVSDGVSDGQTQQNGGLDAVWHSIHSSDSRGEETQPDGASLPMISRRLSLSLSLRSPLNRMSSSGGDGSQIQHVMDAAAREHVANGSSNSVPPQPPVLVQQQQQQCDVPGGGGNGTAPQSPDLSPPSSPPVRMLSLRISCAPNWLFGAAAGSAVPQPPQLPRPAVNVHATAPGVTVADTAAPRGLWPTASFSIAPVGALPASVASLGTASVRAARASTRV